MKRIAQALGFAPRPDGSHPLLLICGPCVLESLELGLEIGEQVRDIARKLGINYVFKASYLKDNRTTATSFQGPGLELGLSQLAEVKQRLDVPILSDVHTPAEAEPAAQVLDILQLPAYLSKQTQLTLALGKTGKPINVKKAQFMTAADLSIPIGKLRETGNDKLLLTERGTMFGYRDLICDFRNLPQMRALGFPVIFDVTHIVRIPGYTSTDTSGGMAHYIFDYARAAAAVGVDGFFIETHPNPSAALCDAQSMLPLARLQELLEQVLELDELRRQWEHK
jgi:2-dehydro-3-deoxyphosphooctonate aldolase (KDO 8-P synthase)